MPRTSTARARLVDSASRLIHASTYASTNVDDLCAAAGVRKGSFYYFFASKRDLALAAIDESWARAQAAILEPAFAPDLPPLERVVRFFRRAAERQSGVVVLGCPFGNLALELSTRDEVIRDRVRMVFEGYCRYFEQALSEAMANGSIEIRDTASTARALLAYFQGAMLLAKTHNDSRLIDELAEHALSLIGARPNPVSKEPL
jgi:TetR/AcrR family transcriptional regulator, transcriptional repressor for nem operon